MKIFVTVDPACGLLRYTNGGVEPGNWILGPHGHLIKRQDADAGTEERPAPTSVETERSSSPRR